MRSVGVDIGTTAIKVILFNDGFIERKYTKANLFLEKNNDFEAMQDPKEITDFIVSCIDKIIDDFVVIGHIGVTGQMHGILYVDDFGNLLSPLYTWLDKRSEAIKDEIFKLTKYDLRVGYGLLTHYYNLKNNIAPTGKYKILTIGDYVTSKLISFQKFRMHPSNAASLGFFNVKKNCFDWKSLRKIGISKSNFPKVSKRRYMGFYLYDMVYVAIGDNQASYFGSTSNDNDLLINIGTGSQVCFKSMKSTENTLLETRPYIDKFYLQVGAPVCGGKTIEYLAKYIASKYKISYEESFEKISNCPYCGDFIDIKLENFELDLNKGIYENCDLNILINSVCNKVVSSLFSYLKGIDISKYRLVGSGNAIRKNKLLRETIEHVFNKKLEISTFEEEASYGAAKFAILKI